jgi:mono/diheme cytochrome c family protein
MISLGESLDDAQVASVLNYVRTNFGNRYKDVITPAAVAARRASLMQDAGGLSNTPIDPRAGSH